MKVFPAELDALMHSILKQQEEQCEAEARLKDIRRLGGRGLLGGEGMKCMSFNRLMESRSPVRVNGGIGCL